MSGWGETWGGNSPRRPGLTPALHPAFTPVSDTLRYRRAGGLTVAGDSLPARETAEPRETVSARPETAVEPRTRASYGADLAMRRCRPHVANRPGSRAARSQFGSQSHAVRVLAGFAGMAFYLGERLRRTGRDGQAGS